MKYAVVILEGVADDPQALLEGATPLEAAVTPNLDRIAERGRVGTARLTPEGTSCDDAATLARLLGMPASCSAAVLEAAGCEIDLRPGQWALRLDLVTMRDGVLIDRTAGDPRGIETAVLLDELAEAVRDEHWRIIATGAHRGLAIDESGRDLAGLTTWAPSDAIDRSVHRYGPTGELADDVRRLIDCSERVFAEHEINLTRRELLEPEATHVWPWGGGRPCELPSFNARHGLSSTLIPCDQPIMAGLGRCTGCTVARSLDDDESLGRLSERAVDGLATHDLVIMRPRIVECAAHSGIESAKVAAIEAVDEQLVGPLLTALEQDDPWRLLITPSHWTCLATRRHDPRPVPFVVAGERIEPLRRATYSEAAAIGSDLHVDVGSELMEYFLFGSGLRSEAARRDRRVRTVTPMNSNDGEIDNVRRP